MKNGKLVIGLAALALVAGVAQAEVKISGTNTERVDVQNGSIVNQAVGSNVEAQQNVASNKGDVKITGRNTQEVDIKNGVIYNQAVGNSAKAEQNIATNDGSKK